MTNSRTLLALFAGLLLASPVTAQQVPGHQPEQPQLEAEARSENIQQELARLERNLVESQDRILALQAALADGESVIPRDAAGEDGTVRRWHTMVEIALSIGVLLFGLAVLWILSSFLAKEVVSGRMYLKMFVLVTVVTAGLFVIVAGYTQDQISPMMGLLGTLVGYLLGREGNAPDERAEKGGGPMT